MQSSAVFFGIYSNLDVSEHVTSFYNVMKALWQRFEWKMSEPTLKVHDHDRS
jgi:uncharacterized protein YajQ (UPF0234 family)